MNKVDITTRALISALDQSTVVQQLKKNKHNLKQNQTLIKQINAFDNSQENRTKLMNHPDYADYMNSLNELNYLIMDLNLKLGKILSSRNCHENK